MEPRTASGETGGGGLREYKNYDMGVNTNALGEEFETTLKVLKGLMGDKIGPNDEYMRDAVHKREREGERRERREAGREGNRGGEIEENKRKKHRRGGREREKGTSEGRKKERQSI